MPISLVRSWLNIAYPADSSTIWCIHSIHCELHALFSLYALDGIIHVRDRPEWENRGFHLFHAVTNKNTARTLLSHTTHAPTFHTLTIPSIPPVTNLDPSWLKHTTFWYDSFSPKSLRTEPTVFTNSLPLVDNSTILEVFPPEAGPFRYSMKIETFI